MDSKPSHYENSMNKHSVPLSKVFLVEGSCRRIHACLIGIFYIILFPTKKHQQLSQYDNIMQVFFLFIFLQVDNRCIKRTKMKAQQSTQQVYNGHQNKKKVKETRKLPPKNQKESTTKYTESIQWPPEDGQKK